MMLCRASSIACWILLLFPGLASLVSAQQASPAENASASSATSTGKDLNVPNQVDVDPVAPDSDIASRIESILVATDWYQGASVKVDNGVVFLSGQSDNEQHQAWAADLARNTEGVAAVVNQIQIRPRTIWDLTPAWEELRDVWRRFVLSLPYLLFAVVVLSIAWWVSRFATFLFRRFLNRRIEVRLLREVIARGAGLVLFLLGLYLVLRVSGLTRLAVTVLGGTGLIGLIIGIAFRDITENFLASIFLSMQHPFRPGDLVEIAGELGYVQRLTTRTTILMTLDGNLIQIPNSTVYKSTIRNFTSNPNRRESFTVGIGYCDAIADAQQIAMEVLAGHPAVLQEPEPWVLVDSLGSSTVNLKVYFWLDGRQHSWLKVRSSVIRLIKRAFQERAISMPDPDRELILPQGATVNLFRPQRPGGGHSETGDRPFIPDEPSTVSQRAEGGLTTDAKELERQALQARPPEDGQNLLQSKNLEA